MRGIYKKLRKILELGDWQPPAVCDNICVGTLLILKIDRKEAINMTKVDIISGFLGAGKNYIYQKAAQ